MIKVFRLAGLLTVAALGAQTLFAQNKIDTVGNVGIGTKTPSASFEVVRDFKLGVGGGQGGQAYSIGFTRPDAQLYGTNASGLLLGGDVYGIDMAILPNGNVGIGTATPAYKLDVQGGSINIGGGANRAFRAGYVTIGNTGLNNRPYISFNAILTTSDISTAKNLFTPVYNTGSGLVIMGEAGYSGLHILQKNYFNGTAPYDLDSFTEVFTIASNGAVGIGTTTLGSNRLSVEGTIAARKVRVTQSANWADFVFHPDYKLPPLHEVESFIKSNQHLPEIPSAAEVEKEGIDLGDMDKKLLQKIEELTLYIIDQQKTINKLLEKDKAMELRLQQLEKK